MKLLLVLLSCLVALALCDDDNYCGGTFRGFQYTITSPNYPRNYPSRTKCVYRLQGDSTAECEQQFHLQFLDFNLKASEGCKGDYLQVGDKNVYCGSTVGLRKFVGRNNTLVVTFNSDEKDTAKGFKILVSALPCSLKLSPLKNPSFKGFAEESRSTFHAREIPSPAYRRGIRGGIDDGVNNSATRLNLLPNDVIGGSIRRPQIDTAAGEDNSIINGNSINNNPRITSYLFLPPKETTANVTLHYDLGPTISDKTFEPVTSPSNDLLPPNVNSIATFSKDVDALNKKIGVPARNYGEPGLGVVDYDVQVGSDCDKNSQVLQPSAGSSERINYDPIQGGGIGYDPKYGFVGAGYPSGGGGYYPNGGGNYPIDYPGGLGGIGGGYNPGIGGGLGGIGDGYNPGIGGGYNPGIGGGYNPGIGVPNYPNGGYDPIGSSYPNYPGGSYPSYPGGSYPSYPGGSYPGYDPINPNYNPSIGGGFFPGSGIGSGGECCRVPSTRRFSIVSPGFPGGLSSNNGYSCRYTITKSSPDICRLRLNFRFFNFGADDPYCSLGYVDIDGQKFCGCKTGQTLQILFTDYIAKTISIFNAGYPRTKLSGFLIDVVQETCGQGAYPGYPGYNPGYNPGYPGYNTGYSGYSSYIQRRSVNASTIDPSPVDPNPLIRNKRDLGYSYQKPNVPFLNKNIDLIPSVPNGQTHERFLGGSCQSRVLFDWAIASKEALLKNARCGGGIGIPGFGGRFSRSYSSSDFNERVAKSDCEEINETEGQIKSPSYPNTYPSNIKKCYRFNKAANFCKLEVYVRDFDLETSQGCVKDYLSFSVEDKKYCGRSLNDFKTMFDLTHTNSVEVDFASDERGTGRGFNISFVQLPCEEISSF